MISQSQISYIKHQNINDEKWSLCIENAANNRFYANSWHLDRTAGIWDALVWADYEYVMPLPVRTQIGIRYVYQPLFCQQLGIFPEPSPEVAKHFYKALYDKFRYVDYHLNSKNPSTENFTGIKFLPRVNYLLDLKYNYKSLAKNYSTNTKRNIAKAGSNNLQFISGIPLDEYIAFKKANVKGEVMGKEIEKLKSIIAFGQYKGFGEIYGVYTAENELCAAVYFCRWKNRIIYFNAASDKKGKELGGMYFLVDNFIKISAGSDFVLDFEGSMVPGVARFYSGFGAGFETYFQLKINRLPLAVRWLKRLTK